MVEKKKSSMRPALRVLLIVSLGLNLLIAGVLVGGVSKGKHFSPKGNLDISVGPFSRAFDEDDRRAIRDDLRSRMTEFPSPSEQAAAMQNLVAAMRAEPLDEETLTSAFSAQREQAARAMELGQDVVLERLREMTADERAEFVDRLLRDSDRRFDRDHKDRDGDRDRD